MKVCVVVCNSVWFDPRVRKQIIEYQKNDVEVLAVGLKCARYDKEKIALIPCNTNIVSIDANYDGKQKGILRKLKRGHLRRKAIFEAVIAIKPDIIHANDLDALLAVFPAYRKLKCKLIYDSHEICVENIGMRKRYKFIIPFMKLYEKYMINRLNLMICVSNAAADYFVQKYKIKKPMVITNCALKSEIIVADKKNKGFEVLNHGQFYDGRGYDLMIETAQFLEAYPDVKLALRGFGILEQQLKDKAKELNCQNVIFYPRVNVGDLIKEASCSMVGLAITEPICLNFKLSVSNKLFEYAAAGLPVIMSDIPEHRFLNEKYHFGLILKKDEPKELANAIIHLYQDKDFYKECQKNAVIMANEINWENEFAKLIEKERELLGLV